MPRPMWSGVVSLGLVTVPVQLFTATENHAVHFHQLQRGSSDRIRYQRVNERTGKEVDYGDIVKGYDVGDGYVVVEPEELDEIAPGKSQTIDIAGFVDLDEVEPVFFDRTYYLAPKGAEYEKVYALLRAALEKENKTGIATFVMRGKQYLIALRAQQELLVLHTLHWADEVRDPHGELPRVPSRRQGQTKELDSARQLIDAMSIDWRPEDYHDTYEAKVEELVKAKAEGKEIASEEPPPEATNVVDLSEALQRSVDQTRKERQRSGRGGRARRRASSARGGGSRQKPARKAKRGKSAESRLKELNKTELYEEATRLGLEGRSKMSREQLLDALATTAS